MLDKLRKLLGQGIDKVIPGDQSSLWRAPAPIPRATPSTQRTVQSINRATGFAGTPVQLPRLPVAPNRPEPPRPSVSEIVQKRFMAPTGIAPWDIAKQVIAIREKQSRATFADDLNKKIDKIDEGQFSIPRLTVRAANEIIGRAAQSAANIPITARELREAPDSTTRRQKTGQLLGEALDASSLIPVGGTVSAGVKGARLATRVAQGAKVGLKYGAGYGAGYGLSEALQKPAPTIKDYIVDPLTGAFTGGLAGGAVGGGIPLATAGASKGIDLTVRGARRFVDDLRPGGILRNQSGYLDFPGAKDLGPDQYRNEIKKRLSAEADDFFANEKQYKDAARANGAPKVVTDSKRMFTEFRKNPDAFIDKYGLLPPDKTGPIIPTKTVNTAYKQTVKNGGVTISIEGQQPKRGVAYSPFKDTEFVVDKKSFTPDAVQTYMQSHADKLNQPGNHLGVWEDNGKIYLDISQVGDLNADTLARAMDAQQLAAFDLGSFEEIPLGKVGKTGYTALYEAANHPYLNQGKVPGASAPGAISESVEVRPGQTPAKIPGLTQKELDSGQALGLTPEQILEAKATLAGPKVKATVPEIPLVAPKTPTTKTVRDAIARLSPPATKEPVRLEIAGRPKAHAAVRDLLETISRGRMSGSAEESIVAASIEKRARELGIEPDMKFIDKYQAGKLKTDAEKELGAFVKSVTDRVFKTQETLTPGIKYRKNYVPQSYQQDSMTVAGAVQKLQTATKSAQPRKFKTYAEADAFGLTPKYKNAAQMIGSNAGEATRAAANQRAIRQGIEAGVLDVSPHGGWAPVEGFFTDAGEQVYAQKKVADILNGSLQKGQRGVDKAFRATANIAGGQQDIALAGGYKHYNFFTFSQAVRDATRTVGTALTGRPWQATKQGVHILTDFARAGTVERAQNQFVKNADFIRDLARAGLPINFQTTLTGADKGKLGRGWGKLFHNATFSRLMPLRMLSTAQDIYATAVKQGVKHDAAIQLAADQTKQFMGIVDTLAKGRSNLANDIFGTVAFAPKYREGIINSLGRAIQSMVDPRTYGDKSFRASRELAVGMITTFVAMDALNYKLNGHHSWDNRKGQELSLQIKIGEKDDKGRQPVINIPFMPGYATVPRAVFEMIRAAKDQDNKAFTAAASKLASMPLQTAGRLYSNQDYFGNPIYTSKEIAAQEGVKPDSVADALKKVGLYTAGQVMPSYGRGAMDYIQGKPVYQALAQAAEAPVRFGKVPNPETVAYITSKDEAYKRLNPNLKAKFDSLFPKGKNALGDDIKETNPNDRITKATILKGDQDLFAEVSKWQQDLRSKTNQVIDPVYDLPWNQAQNVLWARSLAPGESSETKQQLLYDQPWYKEFHDQEISYYDALEKKLGKKDDPYNYPKETERLNQLQEAYFKLPKGQGYRKDFLNHYPEIIKYWDARKAAQNRHRIALGLPPLEDDEDFGSGSGYAYGKGSGEGKSRKSKGFQPPKPETGASAATLQKLLNASKVSVKSGSRRIRAKKVQTRKTKI